MAAPRNPCLTLPGLHMQAQLHEFNMPAQMAAYTNTEGYDTADDATVYDVDQLEEGDLVIFATDGLFDNMWNDEMQAHIEGHLKASAPRHAVSDIQQSFISLHCHA